MTQNYLTNFQTLMDELRQHSAVEILAEEIVSEYEDSLDGLLGLLGVSNWQYFFCDVDMNQPKYESLFNELNNILDQLSQLFSTKNFETYGEML